MMNVGTITRWRAVGLATATLLLMTQALALTAVLTMNDGTTLTLTEAGYLDETFDQGAPAASTSATYLQWGKVRLVEASKVASIAFSYAGDTLTKSIQLKSGSVPVSRISKGIFCIYGITSDLKTNEMFCNYAGKVSRTGPLPVIYPIWGGDGYQASNVVFQNVVFQP